MTRAVPVSLDEPWCASGKASKHETTYIYPRRAIVASARALKKNGSRIGGTGCQGLRNKSGTTPRPEIAGHEWAGTGRTIVTTVPRIRSRAKLLRSAPCSGGRRTRTQNPVINEAVAITIWRTSRRERQPRRRCHGKYGVSVRGKREGGRGDEKREEREVQHAENINAASLIVSQDSRVSRCSTLSSIPLRNVPATRFAIV